MRITKLGWLLIAMMLLAGLAAIVLLQTNAREHALGDGARYVAPGSDPSYGKHENIQLGGLLDRLKQELPQAWVQRFAKPNSGNRSSWWNNTTIHTNDDALYIYVSRRKGALGDYQDVGTVSAQMVDDDGCAFIEAQAGGEDNGMLPPRTLGLGSGPGNGSSLNWYRFEAFPRRQRKFKLRLLDGQGKLMSEFTIRNPAPPPPKTNWIIEELPIITNQRRHDVHTQTAHH